MECRKQLSLVMLLLLRQTAAQYVRLCSLRASEILPVTFDKESGEYVLVPDHGGNSNSTNASGTRKLHSVDMDTSTALQEDRSLPADHTQAISVTMKRRMQQDEEEQGKTVYVRECVCSYRPGQKAYCPIDKSTCGIPRDINEPIGCFNQSSRTSLIRNAWPVIVLWYGGLVIFLLFTAQGRNARHFVVGKFCNRNLNNQLVEQYWYIEGGFWRRRRQRRAIPSLLHDVRNRARMRRGGAASSDEDQPSPSPSNAADHATAVEEDPHPPNQLALKTKRYVAPRSAVQDDDDLACTICFTPLENDDRVGALPCNHSFHVDCLKEWLPRRNICPLCQAPNVASPQYQPRDNEQQEENSLVDEQQTTGERDRLEEAQLRTNVQEEQRDREATWTVGSHPYWMHYRGIDPFRGTRQSR